MASMNMRPRLHRIGAGLRLSARFALGILRGRGHLGTCPICAALGGARTVFVITGTSLRESVLCVRCRSSARNRAMMLTVVAVQPSWRAADVFEGGAGGALSRALARTCRSYIGSRLLADVPRGQTQGEFQSEDLQALSLADASIDLAVSEDVFEHVWEPARAFSEIARVLRGGGVHIFTVPFNSGLAVSRRRIEIDGSGSPVYIEPAEFHDDPLDPEGVLVATDWGEDLPEIVSQSGGLRTEIRDVIDARRGIYEPCVVLVSRKEATFG